MGEVLNIQKVRIRVFVHVVRELTGIDDIREYSFIRVICRVQR